MKNDVSLHVDKGCAEYLEELLSLVRLLLPYCATGRSYIHIIYILKKEKLPIKRAGNGNGNGN